MPKKFKYVFTCPDLKLECFSSFLFLFLAPHNLVLSRYLWNYCVYNILFWLPLSFIYQLTCCFRKERNTADGNRKECNGEEGNKEEIVWIFGLFSLKEIKVKLRRNNIGISWLVCFTMEREERNEIKTILPLNTNTQHKLT